MSKRLTLLALAAIFVAATGAMAQTIDGSAHDLGANDTETRVCIFCHTPHGSSTQGPLWNHTLATSTYTAYGDPNGTINATLNDWTTSGGGVSGLCMSCHDNTVGIGSVINDPNFGTITDPGTINAAFPGTIANLGTNLADDHPVQFDYDTNLFNADGELENPSNLSAEVKLFSGQVACASCHDPHDTTNPPFLVKDNANSDLCFTCHVK